MNFSLNLYDPTVITIQNCSVIYTLLYCPFLSHRKYGFYFYHFYHLKGKVDSIHLSLSLRGIIFHC